MELIIYLVCTVVGILAAQALFLEIQKKLGRIDKVAFGWIFEISLLPIIGSTIMLFIGYFALS